jgi:methylated-DNA-[protein]-cysteine S-methyltransferase
MNTGKYLNKTSADFSLKSKDVYDLLTKIPSGKVVSYGDIAKALGHPKSSRAIGRILSHNPNPIIVPCHRVVKSNGKIGGFAYGEKKKMDLLEEEGIKVKNGLVKDFNNSRFVFTK